jgi:hypothetical protein
MLTGNRVSDRAGASRLPSHATNRLGIYELNLSQREYLRWGSANGVPSIVLAWINERGMSVFASEVPTEDQPFCTPRSLHHGCRMLKHDETLLMSQLGQTVMSGFIGFGMATQLRAHAKYRDMVPTLEEILRSPKTAKLPPQNELSARHVVIWSVLNAISAKAKNAKPFSEYVMRLDKDLVAATLATLGSQSPQFAELCKVPEFGEFIVANQHLMVDIMVSGKNI